MSPTTIIYGDEVRGYGLAILGIVWCLGAIWAFLEAPRGRTFLVAQAAALFAVQTHFGNCFLLLAICAGGAAVCRAPARAGEARPLSARSGESPPSRC